MKRLFHVATLFVVLSTVSVAGGKQAELEKVAKDWCAVIRASQVMPVYPMTEDLFPGDIFLVQQTINEQQKEWKKSGYLPLDYHIERLDCTGYRDLYAKSFSAGSDTLPASWLKPSDSQKAWKEAPIAAFPTYSFSVKRNTGFSAALPIHAVPVGLTLLGASEAHGSVSLSDARTYGVDICSLYNQLNDRVRETPKLRQLLSNYVSTKDHSNYLRVVNRVYLVGKVSVSVSTERATGIGVKANVPTPVDMIMTAPQAKPAKGQAQGISMTQYEKNIDKLNEILNKTYTPGSAVSPGATLQVAAASDRSVSLATRFDRPQVIGYLGFDVEILPDGTLGPPIPTWSIVNNRIPMGVQHNLSTSLLLIEKASVDHAILKKWAMNDEWAAELLKEMDGICQILPDEFPCNVYTGSPPTIWHRAGERLSKEQPRTPAERMTGFERVTQYRGSLDTSVKALAKAVTAAGPGCPTGDLALELQENMRALRCLEGALAQYGDLLGEADRYTASRVLR